ncbi:MAG: type II secretion system F family protein [Alphaproteobacteria bacterium]|nr:type II secretion system F family protein [Alphaproteobacteria bacterium]
MSFSTGNIDQTGVILFGAGLAVFFLVLAFAVVVARSRSQLRHRLTSINQRHTGKVLRTAKKNVSVKRKTSYSSFDGFDRFLQRVIPRPAALRTRLLKTGKSISIGEYALANMAVAAVATYLVHRFSGISWAPSILAGIGVGLGLPHLVIGFMIGRRIKNFIALVPEAIELIVRGLKSGLPVQESILVVGREISDPVGVEFRHIADAIKIGTSVEDAMWATSARLDIPEFKFFVISLAIQRETGGNLTETLSNLADILRKRRQMKLKVKAMSGEAKASALIIGSLPFVMFGILLMLNGSYVLQLFEETRGIMLVGFGLFWMSLGFLSMAKMIRFEI